jgi:hypothetical protein
VRTESENGGKMICGFVAEKSDGRIVSAVVEFSKTVGESIDESSVVKNLLGEGLVSRSIWR